MNDDNRKRGKASKRRGYYYEAKLVKLLRDAGFDAVRNPGSGAYPGFRGDVVLEGKLVEVKSRKSGFAFDEYLEPERGNWCLVTFDSGTVGSEPLVRLRLGTFTELLRRAGYGTGASTDNNSNNGELNGKT